jgi:hypothetical protein
MINLSPAMRAVIAAALLIALTAAAFAGDYLVATWRADQAVRQSEQVLCGIVNLVTASPVPAPADPSANPSRESSYRFYEAFVTVGRQYHC